MYHHSESPEVIHAKLAEWERSVTAHRAQAEAERLLTGDEDRPTLPAARSLSALVHRLLRPVMRMHEQPGG